MDVLILLGSFALLCALGLPVAYALGLSALIAAFWVDIPLEAVMLKISDGTDDFALLAIPFFVLAGAIMAEGGMAMRLINLARVFVGFIRGGLALVNILASTLFGCISGSSVADTASIGSVMIPQMVKAGYPRVFATNVTICGSVQALLIPPSHNAVIYSLAAGGTISVAKLFIAGVFPGLLFGLCLIGLVLWTARKRSFPKGEPIPLRDVPRIVVDALWGLVTVVIIMGGILSGVFTPTESAAVACVYAFLVTFFVYRDYKWRELPHLVHRVVKTVAMVMMLIGFSVAFGYMMAIMQIPAKVTAFFLSDLREQVRLPVPRQHPAAAARHVHGPGADAADLHADLPAGDPQARHRSGAFRHDHDPESRHRPDHAAGGADAVRRLRDRQGDDGAGGRGAMAVLRRDVRGAAARHLHSGDLALAPARAGVRLTSRL